MKYEMADLFKTVVAVELHRGIKLWIFRKSNGVQQRPQCTDAISLQFNSYSARQLLFIAARAYGFT